MNVNCIICSDLFQPNSEVFSTTCGHVFHHTCLIQWLERSRTCPQCRTKCTEKSIHRVYFNISSSEGITDDAVTLQSKLDSIKYQLTMKDKDIQNYNDKYKTVKTQNIGLRGEVQTLESKERVLESAIRALKDQIGYFKDKSRDTDKLNEEVTRLKRQISSMDDIRAVCEGNAEQVADMLRNNNDPQSLCILVVTLKKELIETDRRRIATNNDLKKAKMIMMRHKDQRQKWESDKIELQQIVEVHKYCDSEKQNLKRKISELHRQYSDLENSAQSSNANSSIQRILMESPAPLHRQLKKTSDTMNESVEIIDSPTVTDKVKIIQASDSPYLPIKTNNIGNLGISRFKSIPASSTRNKFSIFKQNLNSNLDPSMKVSKPEYSYDGLGGHSKEEKYPSPISVVTGVKRTKSSSSVSSNKFKKLAPNRKINPFFTNSDGDS